MTDLRDRLKHEHPSDLNDDDNLCDFCELDGRGRHAPRCPVSLEAELVTLTAQRDALEKELAELKAHHPENDCYQGYPKLRAQRDALVEALHEQRRQLAFPGLPSVWVVTMTKMIDEALAAVQQGKEKG